MIMNTYDIWAIWDLQTNERERQFWVLTLYQALCWVLSSYFWAWGQPRSSLNIQFMNWLNHLLSLILTRTQFFFSLSPADRVRAQCACNSLSNTPVIKCVSKMLCVHWNNLTLEILIWLSKNYSLRNRCNTNYFKHQFDVIKHQQK